jgi:hypothetical protein
MALQHAVSGERIALQRGEDDIANFTSIALIKTDHMELIRLVLPTEKPLPNEMVYLAGGEPHAVRANKDAVALMTILLHPGDNSGGPTRDPRGAPNT